MTRTPPALLLLGVLSACTSSSDGTQVATKSLSEVSVDFDAANEVWPDDAYPLQTLEDLGTVKVIYGEDAEPIIARTHVFGEVTVIPYADEDGVENADGTVIERRDAGIAEVFAPGDVGYAIKHHRPEYRTLALSEISGDSSSKEHLKLQTTHIGNVIGVERDGLPGAITLNNPQTYQDGLFGDADYPMVFVRPTFPDYIGPEAEEAFEDNIRTMIAGFNAVTDFPGDYNGGDPLASHTPDEVTEHTAQMIRAIAGDEQALAFFEAEENLVYCAELSHLATTAGIHIPLNEQTLAPLVGAETWAAFSAEIDKHNAGEDSRFSTLNENPHAALVELTLAPEALEPIWTYAAADEQEAEAQKLAFQPMTAADIVALFLRSHVPREELGEELGAAIQGRMLTSMKDGLLESMGLDQLPEDDERRIAAETLFGQITSVVGTPHEDYQAFLEALEPYLEAARELTGPRDDTGRGLYVPPSLMVSTAAGDFGEGGLLGLEYVGHGVHWSLVSGEITVDPQIPEDDDDADADDASCVDSCGGQAPAGCYCDSSCTEYGDCCTDFADVCEVDDEPTDTGEPDTGEPEVDGATCVDSCGGASPDGSCYCDSSCETYGDCCSDFEQACAAE